MHDYNNMFFGMHFIWWIVLIIIILAIIFYNKSVFIGGNISDRENKDTALDILDKRYANGEITLKEYDEIRKKLEL